MNSASSLFPMVMVVGLAVGAASCGQTTEPGGSGGLSSDGAATGSGGTTSVAPGTGPECSSCSADADCASPLVCGRLTTESADGFCVEGARTTECCLTGSDGNVGISLCLYVDGRLSDAYVCPEEHPAPGATCQKQEDCGYGADACWCDGGVWECSSCPTTAPIDGSACEDCETCMLSATTQECSYASTNCDCTFGTWSCGANCSDAEVSCGAVGCIDEEEVCDGVDDCDDGSDEDECFGPPGGCTPGQFSCEDDSCVDASAECDGVDDCDDGSDESECPPCFGCGGAPGP